VNAPSTPSLRIVPTTSALDEQRDPAALFVPRNPADLLVADPARRTAVTFRSAGLTIAAHLYRPSGAPPDRRTPGVVLCGPFSSIKEQTLPHYCAPLADAGYTALTFDPRSFGESEGRPRFHHDPSQVIEDFSNAVSHLITRPDVDPERIAVVGVCMGGGYAVSTAARDKRVRAVVSIAGGYNIGGTFQRMLGVEGFAAYYRKVNDLMQRQYETGEVEYVPTIAHGLSAAVPVAAMPVEEAYSYYDRTSKADAPNWSRKMTAASLMPYFTYNSIVHAPLVAPTPLMIIHGTVDTTLLPEYAQDVYDAAIGPKEFVWIEADNHIQLYDQEPWVSTAAGHAIRWLDRHIGAT
jgi:hypothetical protein